MRTRCCSQGCFRGTVDNIQWILSPLSIHLVLSQNSFAAYYKGLLCTSCTGLQAIDLAQPWSCQPLWAWRTCLHQDIARQRQPQKGQPCCTPSTSLQPQVGPGLSWLCKAALCLCVVRHSFIYSLLSSSLAAAPCAFSAVCRGRYRLC